jgi:hypothetical protein
MTMDNKIENSVKEIKVDEQALKAAAGKPLFRVKAHGADVMRRIIEQCCVR